MELYNGYFNGYKFNELGLVVSEYSTYTPANEEYEVIEVEGRSGNINIPKGTYPERSKTIIFRIKADEFTTDKKDLILDWLININDNKLIYDIQQVYRVKRTVIGEITCSPKIYYDIPVEFICEPWLTDFDEEEFTTTLHDFSLGYNGTIEGSPIIEVYGSGNIQLTCNGETIQIKNVEEYVKIDSELLEVVDKNNQSKDWDTIGNYPRLSNGDNNFEIIGNVNKTKITFYNKYR